MGPPEGRMNLATYERLWVAAECARLGVHAAVREVMGIVQPDAYGGVLAEGFRMHVADVDAMALSLLNVETELRDFILSLEKLRPL